VPQRAILIVRRSGVNRPEIISGSEAIRRRPARPVFPALGSPVSSRRGANVAAGRSAIRSARWSRAVVMPNARPCRTSSACRSRKPDRSRLRRCETFSPSGPACFSAASCRRETILSRRHQRDWHRHPAGEAFGARVMATAGSPKRRHAPSARARLQLQGAGLGGRGQARHK
jgi:hypothetical protein